LCHDLESLFLYTAFVRARGRHQTGGIHEDVRENTNLAYSAPLDVRVWRAQHGDTSAVIVRLHSPGNIIVMLTVFGFFYGIPYGVNATYMTESFQTHIRGTAVGGVYNVGRVGAAIPPPVIGLIATKLLHRAGADRDGRCLLPDGNHSGSNHQGEAVRPAGRGLDHGIAFSTRNIVG
jgi:hypothetical protein